jgi:hypothetical protein
MADPGNPNTGISSIAGAVNRGTNPNAKQSNAFQSNPTGTQKGLSTVGTLGTAAGANPAIGMGLTALGALNTGYQSMQHDLGVMDTIESVLAGTVLGEIPALGLESPLDKSIAMNKGNQAAPTPYASGITAHSPSLGTTGNPGVDALNAAANKGLGRMDYQGAPIDYSSRKGTPQQQQDVLDAVNTAAQQSLSMNKGNVAAPVGYSSGITANAPSIAGSVSQANQATASTATGGPRGMSSPSTASVGTPGMSNKGLSLGDIPGISPDIASMTMDLSPIASQVSQAISDTTSPNTGGGMSEDAMGELAGMAAAEAQEADEASGGSSSSSSGSTSGGAVGGGGAADAHFNQGGMIGYQTNDILKDLMRGYF